MTRAEIAEPTIKLVANMEVFLCVVFVDEDPRLKHNLEQWRLGLTWGNPACDVINLFILLKPSHGKAVFGGRARREAQCGLDTCVFLGRAQVLLDLQIGEFCL